MSKYRLYRLQINCDYERFKKWVEIRELLQKVFPSSITDVDNLAIDLLHMFITFVFRNYKIENFKQLEEKALEILRRVEEVDEKLSEYSKLIDELRRDVEMYENLLLKVYKIVKSWKEGRRFKLVC